VVVARKRLLDLRSETHVEGSVDDYGSVG
jgi:hypothetical protein